MCSTCEDTHDKQDVTDIALAIFGRLPKGQKLILSDFVSLLRARTKRVPSWMTSCQVDDIALPLQMRQSLWEEDVCRIVNTMLEKQLMQLEVSVNPKNVRVSLC